MFCILWSSHIEEQSLKRFSKFGAVSDDKTGVGVYNPTCNIRITHDISEKKNLPTVTL